MYIYNLTTLVSQNIADQWLEWMQQERIPALLSSGLIEAQNLYHLLDQDDSEGITYVWQIITDSEEKMNQFLTELDPKMQEESVLRWKDSALSFATKMRRVN